MEDQVFRIVPASNTPLVFLTLVMLLLLALMVVFVYFGFLSKQMTFNVTSEGLTVSGWPYGRTLSLDKLDVDGAAVVSLKGTPYAPRFRSNGVGLPGYKLGWFRLENGERGLLFVTEPERVVYLPTLEGYSLLMSVAEPEALLETLNNR